MTRLLALLFVTCAVACSRPSVMVQRPADKQVDTAVTEMWSQEIAKTARDGDWILTSDPDDLELLALAAKLRVDIIPV